MQISEANSDRTGTEGKIADMAQFLAGRKALDPYIYRFSSPNAIADAFIIVTATSGRHAQGLADGILRLCREKGHEYLSMEGFDAARWILIDCNDVIVHIFQKDARELYRLEDICLHEPKQEE